MFNPLRGICIPPPKRYEQIIKNTRRSGPMQSHSICAILLFGRRETVSRGRLGVASLAFQFAPVEKKGGREQGSVLRLERRWPREKAGKKEGKPHTRAATVSSTSPREIIDSQRGNDVVNTTSEVPEPSGLYSPTSPSTRRHLLVLLLA